MNETEGENPTREELEEQVKRLNRLATDRLYMAQAYRNMLGPKGQRVAAMWDEKRVTRVHYDWAASAATLDGEDRAQVILDVEAQLANAEPVADIDRHLGPSGTLTEGMPTLDGKRETPHILADTPRQR